MEADDVMASYAKQFDGSVTLLTADKDLRQCLVDGQCNMLIDVMWEENPDTREWLPVYHWVIEGNNDKAVKPPTQKHMEGVIYSSAKVSGISPTAWPHFQAIAGDSVDKIRGVEGIGAKGAMDLILAHGTVQGVIDACKSGLVALTKKKIEAVLEFEPFAEGTLLLTTMRTDLTVPSNTTIGIKELIEKRG
jgi:DNA polymerase-1